MSKVEDRVAKRVETARAALGKVSKEDALAQRKSKKIVKRATRKLAKLRASAAMAKKRSEKKSESSEAS